MLINQLQQLSKAATPGPWRVGNGGHSHGTEFEIETAEQDALYLASVHWGDARVESYAPAHHTAEANAALIVALVNSLPAILTAASKLEVAKEALEKIKRTTAPHPDDSKDDQARNCYHAHSIALVALAALEAK
jgi:hypothetical protein